MLRCRHLSLGTSPGSSGSIGRDTRENIDRLVVVLSVLARVNGFDNCVQVAFSNGSMKKTLRLCSTSTVVVVRCNGNKVAVG